MFQWTCSSRLQGTLWSLSRVRSHVSFDTFNIEQGFYRNFSRCNVNCGLTCPPCKLKCEYSCSHSKCSLKCCEPCIPCQVNDCILRIKQLNSTALFLLFRSLANGSASIKLVRKNADNAVIEPGVTNHARKRYHVATLVQDCAEKYVRHCVAFAIKKL